MFLAQDHSVKSQKLLERIGLGSYTTGLDGSQCAAWATANGPLPFLTWR